MTLRRSQGGVVTTEVHTAWCGPAGSARDGAKAEVSRTNVLSKGKAPHAWRGAEGKGEGSQGC